jgi:uncharacterized protein (TIGR00375 family)
MRIKTLAKQAKVKGIHLLATGDCLHTGWMKEIMELREVNEGTYELEETRFVLSTEIEDQFRVHHLLLFPCISAALDFKERIGSKSKNLESDGRPSLRMGAEDIAQIAKDCGALIGPCHAFTPWTSMYAAHDSIKDCYGDLTSYISFVELGLSADINYADRIEELSRLTFLTNSDAHSPYPVRLAREFNRFELENVTFSGLKKGILREGEGRRAEGSLKGKWGSILNVGLPPQEGKYNQSACIACYKHYSITEAIMKRWKCNCGKRIKKGVEDRVEELATFKEPKHPDHRPPYLYIIPLAEIIAMAIGHRSPNTKGVSNQWRRLVDTYGDEVSVLIDAELKEINDFADEMVVTAIQMFREGRIILQPGGGGQYGKIELPQKGNKEVSLGRNNQELRGQITLFEYNNR